MKFNRYGDIQKKNSDWFEFNNLWIEILKNDFDNKIALQIYENEYFDERKRNIFLIQF